ncbi:hypothetical protein PoB_006252600 [Plakobranchus ocellatus]|uniref:Uncharacterized protein n=1 Tax=Plakobranchus ocellatus TaxID=259542 RepID=A0AAV4CVY3_9GAST|nr:hypothetical protein PoB_006252600 [Plakobranchus ocellatus]
MANQWQVSPAKLIPFQTVDHSQTPPISSGSSICMADESSHGLIRLALLQCTSGMYFKDGIGDWFRITLGVRQRCLLSPAHFNILLKRIVTDALKDHEEQRWRQNRFKLTFC